MTCFIIFIIIDQLTILSLHYHSFTLMIISASEPNVCVTNYI